MSLTSPERKRLWVRRGMERLRSQFGGYCGANAPLGFGCGKNGSTPLQWAHKAPTDLSGRQRGTQERLLDIRAYPTHYCLLCRKCHVRHELNGGSLAA
jgi:hypothetical protein